MRYGQDGVEHEEQAIETIAQRIGESSGGISHVCYYYNWKRKLDISDSHTVLLELYYEIQTYWELRIYIILYKYQYREMLYMRCLHLIWLSHARSHASHESSEIPSRAKQIAERTTELNIYSLAASYISSMTVFIIREQRDNKTQQ